MTNDIDDSSMADPDETKIDDNSIPGEEGVNLDGEKPTLSNSVLVPGQIRALMSTRINPGRVKTRDIGGRNTSYVEAWDVKATLTKVFGFGGWSGEVLESKIIDIRDDGRQGTYPDSHRTKAGQPKTPYVLAYALYRLTIHNIGPQGQDVVFTESSIGSNDGWDIGAVADNAIKSAASDALKRCAIALGTQFGLSLYNNGDKLDVIKTLLVPWQAKALADARQTTGSPQAAATQEQLHRASGGGSR